MGRCTVKVTAIEVTGKRAVVLLRPCWLARLFGARETTLELEWRERVGWGRDEWHAVGSRRPLDDLCHRAEIRYALDFRPRVDLPVAAVRRGGA